MKIPKIPIFLRHPFFMEMVILTIFDKNPKYPRGICGTKDVNIKSDHIFGVGIPPPLQKQSFFRKKPQYSY